MLRAKTDLRSSIPALDEIIKPTRPGDAIWDEAIPSKRLKPPGAITVSGFSERYKLSKSGAEMAIRGLCRSGVLWKPIAEERFYCLADGSTQTWEVLDRLRSRLYATPPKGSFKVSEIVEQFGISQEVARQKILAAVGKGLIRRVGSFGPQQAHYFQLVKQ